MLQIATTYVRRGENVNKKLQAKDNEERGSKKYSFKNHVH